jgi:hypothetical protein
VGATLMTPAALDAIPDKLSVVLRAARRARWLVNWYPGGRLSLQHPLGASAITGHRDRRHRRPQYTQAAPGRRGGPGQGIDLAFPGEADKFRIPTCDVFLGQPPAHRQGPPDREAGAGALMHHRRLAPALAAPAEHHDPRVRRPGKSASRPSSHEPTPACRKGSYQMPSRTGDPK